MHAGDFGRFRVAIMLISLLVLFFVVMSRIDYIVNSTLYNYGLKFSYDWANMYWFAYQAAFWVFSAMVALVYWSGSRKTGFDKKVTAALFISIDLLALGGLQDILFYVLWGGGLPANSVVWTWVVWEKVFGFWNSMVQVITTGGSVGVSFLTWGLALRQKKKAS
jgi:hypothetical protein